MALDLLLANLAGSIFILRLAIVLLTAPAYGFNTNGSSSGPLNDCKVLYTVGANDNQSGEYPLFGLPSARFLVASSADAGIFTGITTSSQSIVMLVFTSGIVGSDNL